MHPNLVNVGDLFILIYVSWLFLINRIRKRFVMFFLLIFDSGKESELSKIHSKNEQMFSQLTKLPIYEL